ncbi:MAG: cupin domain-containing protein [Candidatus Eremiobacteraeota bacterium]|nr:cupin domain-containing protein [Candidatus Eremiobacteraeota bacterium]MBV8365145.1 cupin domain-containing protein [Candidatus Eremiobacteraeota bacterium]
MSLKIVNTADVEWVTEQASPGGKFQRAGQKISEALGRDRRSTDLSQRHPFDVEITKVPPGAASGPYHSHSAQFELFLVIAGSGVVRHADGTDTVKPGDAFLFKPNETHQIINDGAEDLVYYVIADNPIGETCYYPDSGKWAVRAPEYRLMRGAPLDYYDGEEA